MAYVECFKYGEDEFWVLIPESLEENHAIPRIQCDNLSVFLRSLSRRGVTINVLISNSQEAINGTLQPLAFAKRDIRKEFEKSCQQLTGEDRGILAKFVLDTAKEPIVKCRFKQK